MADRRTHALSDVLDQLEEAIDGDTVSVEQVVERLGSDSFAALMLVFSLLAVSPASAIPGLTTLVAAVVFLLVAQMMLGREQVWLPGLLTRRRLSAQKLSTGIGWLRRPVAAVERVLGRRLTGLLHRPWLLLPLGLILALTLAMPLMEVIPTSGSIAAAVIALFAAGLLARDGAVVLVALALLLAVPVTVWQVGFAA